MVRSQKRSEQKVSGGKYKDFRKKKKYELGGNPVKTKLGDKKVKTLFTTSKNRKSKLLSQNIVSVDGKKVKIVNVIENPANKHFVRRNILTKGSIVETDIGKVKITSRPGQEGSLSGVLVK